MPMHSGELIYHFLNTIILTALVAAWVLWRYRVAVLKGMQARSGAVVPPAEFGGLENHIERQNGEDVIRWLGRARRGIVIAVVAAISVPSLVMTALYLIVADCRTARLTYGW